MLRLDGVIVKNKLASKGMVVIKGIYELDEDDLQFRPSVQTENDFSRYFEDERELDEWIIDYRKTGYKVRLSKNYGGRAAFLTVDGIGFACSGLDGRDSMKIDVNKLENFIKENKQEEYYYLLADGKIVMFEANKNIFIPWCFPNEVDALRFAKDFTERLGRTEHYQCIKTLNKIESWL